MTKPKEKNGKPDVLSDVRALVAEIIEKEPEEISEADEFVKDLGMDSMMALEILAGIEKKYKIAIPEEMLPKFTTLAETVKIVEGILKSK